MTTKHLHPLEVLVMLPPINPEQLVLTLLGVIVNVVWSTVVIPDLDLLLGLISVHGNIVILVLYRICHYFMNFK